MMKREINFSGLSFELGQTQRGLLFSPQKAKDYFSILRNSGIEMYDRGTITPAKYQSNIKFFNESDLKKLDWIHYEEAYQTTLGHLQEERPLINWGGDHSIALSTVGAFTEIFPEGYVIWIDAHADLNLPSYSLTGNLHGMPMSVLLNLNNVAQNNFKWIKHYLKPEKLIYFGLRDLDPFEEGVIEKLKIKTFTRKKIRQWGIDYVLADIRQTIQDFPVHVSFDIDSVDPRLAPSTGTPVEDGLSMEDLDRLASKLSSLNVRSLDMVEVNPMLGTALQVDQTFITAMQILKKIFAHPGGSDESMGQRNQTEHFAQMEWTF